MGDKKGTPPKRGVEDLKNTILLAKAEKKRLKRARRKRLFKQGGLCLICLMLFLPNINSSMGYALGNMPILGQVFRAVTFRDYHYMESNFHAKVSVPKVISQKNNPTAATTAKSVNNHIAVITDQLIETFKEEMKNVPNQHSSLLIDYEIIETTDKYFTLKLVTQKTEGSGYEKDYYYTMEIDTGKQIKLGDLFKGQDDYIDLVSKDIKRQIKERMAKNPDVVFWSESSREEMVRESAFKEIRVDQPFYIDKKDQLHIIFDEGQIAPMSMGIVDFVISNEITFKNQN